MNTLLQKNMVTLQGVRNFIVIGLLLLNPGNAETLLVKHIQLLHKLIFSYCFGMVLVLK